MKVFSFGFLTVLSLTILTCAIVANSPASGSLCDTCGQESDQSVHVIHVYNEYYCLAEWHTWTEYRFSSTNETGECGTTYIDSGFRRDWAHKECSTCSSYYGEAVHERTWKDVYFCTSASDSKDDHFWSKPRSADNLTGGCGTESNRYKGAAACSMHE